MQPRTASLRRATSVVLTVAFVAMAGSGVLMLVCHEVGFQFRMHPVHNAFGVVMVVAGLVHVALNLKPLLGHLRGRAMRVLAVVGLALMGLLLGAGLTRPIDPEAVRQIEEILSAHHPGKGR